MGFKAGNYTTIRVEQNISNICISFAMPLFEHVEELALKGMKRNI